MKKHARHDFSSLSLSSVILNAVADAGYKYATDVQLEAIPPILAGEDVLARAETGSGKTAAYVLPLLEQLADQGIYQHKDRDDRYSGTPRAARNRVQILVLVPTRELATQVRGVFDQLSKNIQPPITCQCVFGGVKINPQMMALRGGTDVLVATPGRLLELAEKNAVKFNQVKTLIMDEVDRLIKGDFEDEVRQVIKLLPNKRQNLMFTATFPDSIRKLVREELKNPTIVNVDDEPEDMPIEQRVITVNHDRKNDLLAHLLNENDWKQVLIFCSAKRTCNNLVGKLEKRGIDAVAMHGDKEQSARATALRNFKSGETRILVATDVAARGIDIEELACVINYDLPRSPNDYIHRIGRTGRAGKAGVAISLIAHHEYQHFDVIEKRNYIELEREQVEGFEADDVAPPPPERTHKKKAGKPNNKKRKKRMNEQREQANAETDIAETSMRNHEKTRSSEASTDTQSSVEISDRKVDESQKRSVDSSPYKKRPQKTAKPEVSDVAAQSVPSEKAELKPKTDQPVAKKMLEAERPAENAKQNEAEKQPAKAKENAKKDQKKDDQNNTDTEQVNAHIWGKR